MQQSSLRLSRPPRLEQGAGLDSSPPNQLQQARERREARHARQEGQRHVRVGALCKLQASQQLELRDELRRRCLVKGDRGNWMEIGLPRRIPDKEVENPVEMAWDDVVQYPF